MNDAIMRDIIAGAVIAVYLYLLALGKAVNPGLASMALICFGYFFKSPTAGGWQLGNPFKKTVAPALVLFLLLGAGTARADILNPVGSSVKYKGFLNSVNGASINGNLLSDLTQVVNYLGVKEGEVYNFNLHKWVTSSSATIITYAPWNVALDADLLNTDGGGGSIDWNVGQFLPVASVPVMQYTQYLSLIAGVGAENDVTGNVKFAGYAGVQFKLTFGS